MTLRNAMVLFCLTAALAACSEKQAGSFDAGIDQAMALGDLAAADLASAPADMVMATADMAGVGSCSFVLSNGVGTNATIADVVFPFMTPVGKGLNCNDATGPTSCSLSSNGMTNNINWTVYAGLNSLTPPVSVPFISAIAAQPNTAVMVYIESNKRWTSQAGGNFNLDSLSGHVANVSFTVHLHPDPSGANGATGTFDATTTCNQIDFRP